MKKLELTVIIEKGENGYYVGQVQEYPAALSQGKTIDELMINVKDALLLLLETYVIVLSQQVLQSDEKSI